MTIAPASTSWPPRQPDVPALRTPQLSHDTAFPFTWFGDWIPTASGDERTTAARLPTNGWGGNALHLLLHPRRGVTVAAHFPNKNRDQAACALLDPRTLRYAETAADWWPSVPALLAEPRLENLIAAGLLDLLAETDPAWAAAEATLLALAAPERARHIALLRR